MLLRLVVDASEFLAFVWGDLEYFPVYDRAVRPMTPPAKSV